MLQVNMGCGGYPATGWHNLSLYVDDPSHTDIAVHDITKPLPFDVGSIQRIYAGHVLEHIEKDDIVPMLDMWYLYAANDCQLMVVGPDVDRAAHMAHAGQITRDEAHGAGKSTHRGDKPGYAHLWDATEGETLEMIRASRWENQEVMSIEAVPAPWPVVSRIGWQFAILSTKSFI